MSIHDNTHATLADLEQAYATLLDHDELATAASRAVMRAACTHADDPTYATEHALRRAVDQLVQCYKDRPR